MDVNFFFWTLLSEERDERQVRCKPIPSAILSLDWLYKLLAGSNGLITACYQRQRGNWALYLVIRYCTDTGVGQHTWERSPISTHTHTRSRNRSATYTSPKERPLTHNMQRPNKKRRTCQVRPSKIWFLLLGVNRETIKAPGGFLWSKIRLVRTWFDNINNQPHLII